MIGGFATLTFLTKNSFIDQVNQQYVLTARAKGLTEQTYSLRPRISQRDVDRHCWIPECVRRYSLHRSATDRDHILAGSDLGLLGFEAVLKRDYPIMFATLYFFTLLGLVLNLIGDLTYTFIDPRIDFEVRGA